MHLRLATDADAPALLAIYAPYVERTAVSFEEVVPGVEEFAGRIRECNERWAWVVAELNGEAVGYAYGSLHRKRAAYRWSVEVSGYVDERFHRRGIARALYGELLARLAARGMCNAYAGIALPNEASLALHRALGFSDIGVFPRVGRKFGRWHDVAWLHKVLRESPPEEPLER
ncbi:MAG: N-acetyltransferase [Candidatus Eisenbacteria bacterium]|uniref:N-acetyltransferase n=1 Tax=Eiseniibacteriota bacterium TaxID=2212470 RepID=A0A933SIN7_UNCEI|nr:N-acetyltransferase [Candidatus Eisenbacteria bacterium]